MTTKREIRPHATSVVETCLGRLRLIPEHTRDFSIGQGRAEIEYGIDQQLMRDLIELGLSHTGADDGVRFAHVDLHYIGLRLGCAKRHLEAMKGWGQALTAALLCSCSEVSVRCIAYTAPGNSVSVLGPSGRQPSVVAGDRTAMQFGESIPGTWPTLPESLRDVVEAIAALDFCLLPDGLDCDFGRGTGLCDCATAAEILVQECERRGVGARTAYGLLLASPYSTPHSWAEVRQGEHWIPADPLLLTLLADYAGVEPDLCSPLQSPGGMLLRLADAPTPIVLADEEPIQATFLTDIRTAAQTSD